MRARLLQSLGFVFALGLSPAVAQQSVPQAPIPDPDLSAISVMSMWSQLVDGGAPKTLPTKNTGDMVPKMEMRFVLALPPSVTPATACHDTQISITGQKSGAKVAYRGTLAGNLKTPVNGHKTYNVAICATEMDPSAQTVSILLNGKPAMLYNGGRKRAAVQASMSGPAKFGRRTANGKGLRIAFVADTGCRGMVAGEKARMQQDCASLPVKNDAQGKWAFPVVAQQIADSAPDLVIHGGDYHYFYEEWQFDDFWRGTGINRFEYWMFEFLNPAQPMLLESPVAFARGNHELCKTTWFGNGFFELFGPRIDPNASAAEGNALNPCNLNRSAPPEARANVSQTWWFDVAPHNDTSVKPFRFYMIDSGNDQTALSNDVFAPGVQAERDKIWITHIPPTMMLHYGGRNHYADSSVMQAVTNALGSVPGCSNLSCWPRAIFTGHQHLYQKVQLSASSTIIPGTTATEVHIAGHGGTAWDTGGPKPRHGARAHITRCHRWLRGQTSAIAKKERQEVFGAIDMNAQFTTASRHGFLLLDRTAGTNATAGWDITAEWTPGDPDMSWVGKNGSCE